jgi:hypothetical protein
MNEHGLKRKVDDLLRELRSSGYRIWRLKVVGGRFQRASIPDYIISVWPEGWNYAVPLALELKSPTEKAEPSPGQRIELRAMDKAGWVTACMNDYDEIRALLLDVCRGEMPVVDARKW